MKILILTCLIAGFSLPDAIGQSSGKGTKQGQAIHELIDDYSRARENQDTTLLRSILSADVDQLVSTGEWREGIEGSMAGMVRSTGSNPGTRTLTVEKLRFIGTKSAIADARYVIQNPDGTRREMWSTFVVVNAKGGWKITAIRNMLPAR
ncbi:DUF4440 domain-containing protein [Persicitalea jodogahamensis]|uniref:DUF4440 domain-containing protein n=1 Tax=Persicitalea jodogahamensis TaxID=402147 RepID=A0A8J3GAJ7_9BACT|nr:DUF4440 domain-containing protein [Persicitalea jodogahamensis]GHB70681.1 hypothetical protein GCM10007390_25510 [Persicitalea jodogahamensis]